MRGGALLGLLAVAQPPALSPLLLHIPVVGSTAIHANQRVTFVIAFCLAYLAACSFERLKGEERWRGGSWGIWGGALLLAVQTLATTSPVLAQSTGLGIRGLGRTWISDIAW